MSQIMHPFTPWHLAVAFALALGCAAVPAHSLPVHSAVPGGVAVIALPEGSEGVRVLYRDKPALTAQENGIRYAVVGIPLAAEPGTDSVTLRGRAGEEKALTFQIKDKSYPTQHLTIKDKRKVNPLPEDMGRISRELKVMEAAYAAFTPEAVDLRFDPPVAGTPSSSFGSRRVFNGQARNPHTGMDIAAPVGAPILAPAPGKVVLTGDFFFNGQSVFVDHGQGLISMYCHMSRIDVEEGQRVERGELLGAVGKTGRVTGPHLHWTISLNDARVDPELFVAAKRFKAPAPQPKHAKEDSSRSNAAMPAKDQAE